jgi:hypothetical protein
MWPLIETRRPCTSSSQTFSTVPAFPSVRTTALPTSSDRAASSAPRIVNAWRFGVGMVASEITLCARGVCIARCTRSDRSATRIGAASLGIERPETAMADASLLSKMFKERFLAPPVHLSGCLYTLVLVACTASPPHSPLIKRRGRALVGDGAVFFLHRS